MKGNYEMLDSIKFYIIAKMGMSMCLLKHIEIKFSSYVFLHLNSGHTLAQLVFLDK